MAPGGGDCVPGRIGFKICHNHAVIDHLQFHPGRLVDTAESTNPSSLCHPNRKDTAYFHRYRLHPACNGQERLFSTP